MKTRSMSISMSILINSNTIKPSYFNFIKSDSIEIFCPFITTDIIREIVDKSLDITRIITRWKLSDFEEGYADLDLYDLCQLNNIDLYINPRVHLKAAIRNRNHVFISSANITGKGLNFVTDDIHNYELSSVISIKGIQDLIYFEKIVQDSVYVSESVFEEIKKEVENLDHNRVSEPEELYNMEDKAYYISKLPQSSSLSLLFEYYNETVKDYSDEDYNCAVHDLSIFDVSEGLNYEEFIEELSQSFFNHPFINGLIGEVKKDGYIYFGRVKEWIQNNCLDVPVPNRRELTGNVKVLYKWIEVLGKGKFEVDRPHHSQRIKVLG